MKNLRFLIVDDSITARNITIILLKGLGYRNFVEAGNGEEALSKLTDDDEINFIITDWNMLGLSGLDLVRAIRRSEKLCKLPVLMVTFRGKKENIDEALDAKVDNYIVKPFTVRELKERIEEILMKSLKFLIVDDDSISIKANVDGLRRIGYEKFVTTLRSEEVVSMLISDETISFVITDLNMPKLSGIELATEIRKNEKFKKIPILLVTGPCNKQVLATAESIGINGYINKDDFDSDIREAITKALEKADL